MRPWRYVIADWSCGSEAGSPNLAFRGSTVTMSGSIPTKLMSRPRGVRYRALVILTAEPSGSGWMVCTTPLP